MPRLALAVALVLLTWGARAEATRRALVIGQNVGLGPDAPLRFAEDDASAIAATLAEVGAVRREDVTLLVGPDLARVRAELRRLAERSQPADELVFFFSGHGGPDGAHVDGRVWSWSEVRADLDSVTARLVVGFFDACFSGALLTPKGLVRESPLVLSVVPLGGRGRYLVTSSGANELSYESALLHGSPFAEAIRSGLRGPADANGDGDVTLPELYGYLYARTLSATVTSPSGPQHPIQSVRLESAGDVVLVQRRRGAAAPVRGGADLGRCYVLDRDGARVLAELERSSEQAYLPPAEYVVKCVTADRVRVARASFGAAPASLDALRYSDEAPSAELAKGPGAVGQSRFTAAVAVISGAPSGGLVLGYEGGTPDLLASVEGGVTWTGTGLLAAGAGMEVPWWRLGGTRLALGLELAGEVPEPSPRLVLGGGCFVWMESPALSGATRAFARLDLWATHAVDGGLLGATIVGAVGVELGR